MQIIYLRYEMTANDDPSQGCFLETEEELCDALQIATNCSFIDEVRELLMMGADPNCNRVLEMAIRDEKYGIAEELVAAGADPMPHGAEALPLVKASIDGERHLVNLLLNAGASPNISICEGEVWPLIEASKVGNFCVALALLRHGAQPNVMDSQGITPLLGAVDEGDSYLVDALLEHGANPNMGGRGGEMPLSLAAMKGEERIVMSLMRAGARADPDPDVRGKTPIWYAIMSGNDYIASYLLSHGANLVFIDDDGKIDVLYLSPSHRRAYNIGKRYR